MATECLPLSLLGHSRGLAVRTTDGGLKKKAPVQAKKHGAPRREGHRGSREKQREKTASKAPAQTAQGQARHTPVQAATSDAASRGDGGRRAKRERPPPTTTPTQEQREQSGPRGREGQLSPAPRPRRGRPEKQRAMHATRPRTCMSHADET